MNEVMVREYLGNGIGFKVIGGMVYANATEMAKVFGKLPADWIRLKQTQEYVEELKSVMGNHISLIDTVKGGNFNEQGTWIHEKLVLDFAKWLNIKFRVWADETIATLIREGSVSLQPQKKLPTNFKEALLLLVEAEEEKEKLQLENSTLTKEVINKENIIIGLVEDVDLATKRQRLNQIIRHGDKNKISNRYNLLYTEFSNKFHCNLELRLQRSEMKPKIKNKMDLIDREMNMIPQLYELACKIFHSEVEHLKQQWFDTIESNK